MIGKPTVVALFVVAALASANAGSYRRPVEARGTNVPAQVNQTVFGMLSNCYDIPIFDFCTGEMIGTARDCLADIVPSADCTGGMNLTATTIFTIGTSVLSIRSYTSVQPVTVTGAPSTYTHITGSFPPTTPVAEIGILEATGVFAGAEGTVRLSGAVNLDNAPDTISFSCIFVIDVETSSGIDYEYVFQQSGSVALKQQVFFTLLMTLLGILISKTV